MPKTTTKQIIIKSDLLDLIINSEYRTQVKIDLEQLIYLVRNKQDITILIKILEQSIDKALIQILNDFSSNSNTNQKEIIHNLNQTLYNLIIDNFRGINHEQEYEKTSDEVYTILDYFKELQKYRGINIKEFIQDYEFVDDKVAKKT